MSILGAGGLQQSVVLGASVSSIVLNLEEEIAKSVGFRLGKRIVGLV